MKNVSARLTDRVSFPFGQRWSRQSRSLLFWARCARPAALRAGHVLLPFPPFLRPRTPFMKTIGLILLVINLGLGALNLSTDQSVWLIGVNAFGAIMSIVCIYYGHKADRIRDSDLFS